jgi:hypothetical protein
MTNSNLPSTAQSSLGPSNSIGNRARRVAAEDGVSLTYGDGVWVATDRTTGERASDVSMAGAWAHLREVDVYTVHGWLDERDATVVRPPTFLRET